MTAITNYIDVLGIVSASEPVDLTSYYTGNLVTDYTRALMANSSIFPLDSGWTVLGISPPTGPEITSQANALYQAVVTASGPGASAATVAANLKEVLTKNTASLQLVIGGNTTVTSYQDVFQHIFPGNIIVALPTLKAFAQQFQQQQLAENGYFLPSVSFQAWTQFLSQKYFQTFGANNAIGPTTLESADAHNTLILDRIFALVASMVGTMQTVTAAQASRLVLLSQWQKSYTDALSQMHTFLVGDGTPLGVGLPSSADTRTALNDQINAPLREIAQNNRSIVSDDARALQSNVNQSNDSVTQQTDTATTIIQELSTMLSAIFR